MSAKNQIVVAPEADEKLAHFTLYTCDEGQVLSKTWELVDGELTMTAQGGVMAYGNGEVIALEDLSGLAKVLARLGPRNAVSWGTPVHDIRPGEVFRVVTDARAPDAVGDRGDRMFPRTRDNFKNAAGERAVFMIDIDGRTPGKPNPRTAQEACAMIRAALPELDDVEVLAVPSGSACIYNAATGQELRGNTGWRLYVIVEDGSDIPRLGERLFAELWLMGEGYIKLSASGAKLERALVDKSVWQPERLDFVGGANLGEGLIQKRPPPVLIPGTKKALDSRIVPDLTAEEAEEFARLIEAAKAASEPAAAELRSAAVAVQTGRRVGVLREKLKRDPTDDELRKIETAVREQLSAAAGVLSGDHVLELRVGGKWTPVSVADILADPDRYVGCRSRDPFDPTDGDHGGAGSIRRSRDGKLLTVTSFARGQETTYTLTTTAPKGHDELHNVLADKLREAALRRGGEPALAKLEVFWAAKREKQIAAKPTINVQAGQLHDAVEETLDHMRCDPTLFDCGDALTEVLDGRRSTIERETVLSHHLAAQLRFTKHVINKKEELKVVDIDPPTKLSQTIVDMRGRRGLKSLVAVVTAPTLREDGSILSDPGYDAATGLLYAPVGPVPHVPDAPTMPQVEAALETLLEPFSLYHFVTPADRGSLLAGLLTASIRGSLKTAPAFGFDAPSLGAGKTKLALCMSLLMGGDGKEPGTSQQQTLRSEDETRKFIFAKLLQGEPVMLFDNVTGVVKSATLAGMLTSSSFDDRKLGSSETFSLPSRVLTMVTGQNLTLAEDLVRRFLIVSVNPGVEKPQLLQFAFDPLKVVRDRRVDMVVAALTLIRGRLTMAAGESWASLGSFETWSWLVLDTVRWLSERDARLGDPLETQARAEGNDPTREAHGDLLRQFATIFGIGPAFKSGDVCRVLGGVGSYAPPLRGRGDDTPPVDREAVRAAQEAWGELVGLDKLNKLNSSKAVGRQLSFRANQIVDGLELLREEDSHTKVVFWRIRAVTEDRAARQAA